ncbi:MAG: aminotransferase class I/II-fold pyridoxal phosphate-dependent enzyme, partial [Planctomycetota bacterium]
SLKVLDILSASADLRDKLQNNTRYFREQIAKLGLDVIAGEHPIVPIMLGDAVVSQNMAEKLLQKGVYVIGFSYPVVPKAAARIRTQISAAHSKEDLDFAIEKISDTKRELGV